MPIAWTSERGSLPPSCRACKAMRGAADTIKSRTEKAIDVAIRLLYARKALASSMETEVSLSEES